MVERGVDSRKVSLPQVLTNFPNLAQLGVSCLGTRWDSLPQKFGSSAKNRQYSTLKQASIITDRALGTAVIQIYEFILATCNSH